MPRWLADASRWWRYVSLCAAMLLGACRKPAEERSAGGAVDERSVPISTTSQEGLVDATATPLVPRDAAVLVPATRRACRIMMLHGGATSRPRLPDVGRRRDRLPGGADAGAAGGASIDGGAALAPGDLVPEGHLIELASGAELTVQSTVSTREITLVGPSLAEACPDGEEAIRLSYGKVSAFPGGGVRPGAEVSIATPLGVVRFNDAKIDITIPSREADRIEVLLATGHATFVPAVGVAETSRPDEGAPPAATRIVPPVASARVSDASIVPAATGESDVTLVPGVRFTAKNAAGSPSHRVRELVGACVRLGTAAREAGSRVASPTSGSRSALGELAFAHVRARQRARAACESAWAAGALAPGLLDAQLGAALEGAYDGRSP